MDELARLVDKAVKIEAVKKDALRMQQFRLGTPMWDRYYRLCAEFTVEISKIRIGEADGDSTDA